MTEIHLLFFQSTIAVFNNFNRFLQKKGFHLYSMNTQMETFIQELDVEFVKPEKVIAHKEE